MFRPTTMCHAVIVGLVALLSASPLWAVVHTAADQFDDFNNPSPTGWSYLNNGEVLRNFVFNWNAPDFGPGQGGWEGPTGQPWAGWAKLTEDNALFSGFDVVAGDLVTHGPTAEIRFAPSVAAGDPASGSFTISGGVNNIRQLGRSGAWQLLYNNTEISRGDINDSHTSASPSLFSDGCGGTDGITSIRYSDGDTITLKIAEGDFVHVNLTIETSAAAGKEATTCPVPPDPHVGYYRFEEPMDSSDIIDSLSGGVHGTMVNGGTRSEDVPFAIVPQTGEPNLRSADFTQAGHALIEGSQFVFNGPNAGGPTGDATLEWMMKVPPEDEIPNGHTAMIWTNGGGGDTDRFNIFWDASFTGAPDSDRFISGDFRAPGFNGPFDIGAHNNGNPLSEGEWHHIAVVRNDDTPQDDQDSSFTWNWYIDGQLSENHTRSTTAPTPLLDMSWLIAGRQGADSVRAYFDEVRMTAAALSPDQFLIAEPTAPPGDFNDDGLLDAADINLLVGESASGDNDPDFDVTNDGMVNGRDVLFWVKDLRRSWIGDSNLDGEFNSTDLVAVFQQGKYELDQDAVWTQGDWTGDLRFNSSDLVAAFQDGGYEQGPRGAVAAVPEPGCAALWFLGLIMCPARRNGGV